MRRNVARIGLAPAALAVLRQRGSRRAAGGDCPMDN